MKTKSNLQKWLTYSISTVWAINGLLCKVLNLVPRHQQIVERILGGDYSRFLTRLIWVSELAMAAWVLSGIQSRWNAWTQISLIATMNILELIFAQDLLLWGKIS